MCNPQNLHVLSFANGFTLWHYRTDDAMERLFDPGYFDPARPLLRRGDCLITAAGKPNTCKHAVLVITEINDTAIHVNGTLMQNLSGAKA